ncbi:hypothetical protein B0T16DRAFT_112612 [Cercophora newfieldiana]|uniref:Uncharacterized protein n=1 Tax=Cercophora newfieldiana TaxID=92897 RepID=A0AA40CQW9_9PEZI|nr:hypothetical protein B0T16DRAFT_112612 [Cercophora newfieldiana]
MFQVPDKGVMMGRREISTRNGEPGGSIVGFKKKLGGGFLEQNTNTDWRAGTARAKIRWADRCRVSSSARTMSAENRSLRTPDPFWCLSFPQMVWLPASSPLLALGAQPLRGCFGTRRSPQPQNTPTLYGFGRLGDLHIQLAKTSTAPGRRGVWADHLLILILIVILILILADGFKSRTEDQVVVGVSVSRWCSCCCNETRQVLMQCCCC